jgi:drug/metabolite transporter (DMT)-like permease
MNYLMFVYISAIWGSSFILMKWASLSYPPMSLASYRLLSAAAILFIFWILGERKKLFLFKDLQHISVLSLCTILPYAIQPYLIDEYGSGFIGMMVIFVPLLTILTCIVLLSQKPKKREVIGVIGGLVFAMMIIEDGLDRKFTLLNVILAFSIPFFYALGNVYIKKYLNHMKPLNLSFSIMLISGLILWPVSIYMEDIQVNEHFNSATLNLLILGIMGTGIPIIFFFSLIKNQGPLFAGMVTYVIPIGAIGWGVYDGEKTSLLQLVSISGLLFMVALVQWPVKANSSEG